MVTEFYDDFERTPGGVIGNGWVKRGAAGALAGMSLAAGAAPLSTVLRCAISTVAECGTLTQPIAYNKVTKANVTKLKIHLNIFKPDSVSGLYYGNTNASGGAPFPAGAFMFGFSWDSGNDLIVVEIENIPGDANYRLNITSWDNLTPTTELTRLTSQVIATPDLFTDISFEITRDLTSVGTWIAKIIWHDENGERQEWATEFVGGVPFDDPPDDVIIGQGFNQRNQSDNPGGPNAYLTLAGGNQTGSANTTVQIDDLRLDVFESLDEEIIVKMLDDKDNEMIQVVHTNE